MYEAYERNDRVRQRLRERAADTEKSKKISKIAHLGRFQCNQRCHLILYWLLTGRREKHHIGLSQKLNAVLYCVLRIHPSQNRHSFSQAERVLQKEENLQIILDFKCGEFLNTVYTLPQKVVSLCP